MLLRGNRCVITSKAVARFHLCRYNFGQGCSMKRTRSFVSLGLLVCFTCVLSLGAQVAPQVRATEKPFLWRIDGAPPSYLYGTVHVPDQRVLELPEVVRRAFDASDVFNAEIPLDD